MRGTFIAVKSDGGQRSIAPSSSPEEVTRQRSGDLQAATVQRTGWRETWVNGRLPLEGPADLSLLTDLRPKDGVACLRLFGASPLQAAALEVRLPGWEIDLYLSPRPGALPFYGLQALVIQPDPGTEVQHLKLPSGTRAWGLASGKTRLAYLFRVASDDSELLSAYDETYRHCFAELETLGFLPSEVARTWCFFGDVLADYPGFNEARKASFETLGLLGAERIPASTGIQSILASGEHLTMDALAVSGPGINHVQIENPQQCEATSYGSLFSRAIRVEGLGPPMLLISGMASIDDAAGLTLHVDDAEAQTRTTIEKATALLEGGGSSWARVVSGIVYVKPGFEALLDYPPLAELLQRHPLAVSLADVCRDDLLVEIELLAV